MSHSSVVQPSLLSRINERQVLRTIQARGPLSRAEVARHSGISAPTASKAVEALLRAGLLEEGAAAELGRGRPAKKLRLANRTAQVLGLVIDAEVCRVVAAGLDGKLHDRLTREFATPSTYEALIAQAVVHGEALMARSDVSTLGLAVCMPGQIDTRRQVGVLSPNVPLTDGRTPGLDLSEHLGIECILIQESHALCLAERNYGEARGSDDFAMLDVATGVGLGVMSGGRLLTGHSGLAGEIGHITVDLEGRSCGCGNRGCLETVACDSALAWSVSRRLGRRLNFDQILAEVQDGQLVVDEEIDRTGRYLGVALAAVMNLFNPATLFVHGRLFELREGLFEQVVGEARKRALPPSYGDCRIVQARGSKRQGAVAAMIEHLTEAVVPAEMANLRHAGSGAIGPETGTFVASVG